MSLPLNTNSFILTESSIHYVTGFLDRYADKFPTRHHQDALNEFRNLSNKLLDILEEPMNVAIARHKLKHK